jgi:hypothetical protein
MIKQLAAICIIAHSFGGFAPRPVAPSTTRAKEEQAEPADV